MMFNWTSYICSKSTPRMASTWFSFKTACLILTILTTVINSDASSTTPDVTTDYSDTPHDSSFTDQPSGIEETTSEMTTDGPVYSTSSSYGTTINTESTSSAMKTTIAIQSTTANAIKQENDSLKQEVNSLRIAVIVLAIISGIAIIVIIVLVVCMIIMRKRARNAWAKNRQDSIHSSQTVKQDVTILKTKNVYNTDRKNVGNKQSKDESGSKYANSTNGVEETFVDSAIETDNHNEVDEQYEVTSNYNKALPHPKPDPVPGGIRAPVDPNNESEEYEDVPNNRESSNSKVESVYVNNEIGESQSDLDNVYLEPKDRTGEETVGNRNVNQNYANSNTNVWDDSSSPYVEEDNVYANFNPSGKGSSLEVEEEQYPYNN